MDGRANRSVGERVQTRAECAGAGRRADEVLEHHVPADQERYELADGHVAVHVRRTGSVGHSDAEFGVTRACKTAKKRINNNSTTELIDRYRDWITIGRIDNTVTTVSGACVHARARARVCGCVICIGVWCTCMCVDLAKTNRYIYNK